MIYKRKIVYLDRVIYEKKAVSTTKIKWNSEEIMVMFIEILG